MSEIDPTLAAINYSQLSKASITLNHLQSNSATHESPFSAIAELVDNAYDANAENLSINCVEYKGEYYLDFQDDGTGMSPEEAERTFSFGYSSKKDAKIGRYGNGLKSGGLYLGKELLLLTKKEGICTAVLISHRFHNDLRITDSVFVPCPSIDTYGRPVLRFPNGTDNQIERSSEEMRAAQEKHDLEMLIMAEYAPLAGKYLQEWFTRIENSGTIVAIGRLRKDAINELTFNLRSDNRDICIDGDNLPLHKSSLKEYLKILYLEPKMSIRLRNQIVIPRKLVSSWIARHNVTFNTSSFVDGPQQDAKDLETKIKELQSNLTLLESDYAEQNSKIVKLKERRTIDESYRMATVPIKEELSTLTRSLENKKSDKNKTDINVVLGVEVTDRQNDGIHFYINNRLILWGYKNMAFFKKHPEVFGISAYVDLEFKVFRPTHNKQGFDSAKDFNTLVKKLDKHLQHYYDFLEQRWIIIHLKKWNHIVTEDDNIWEILWHNYGFKNPNSKNCLSTLDEHQLSNFYTQCGYWNVCRRCGVWKRARSPQQLVGGGKTIFFSCEAIPGQKCIKRSLSDRDSMRGDPEDVRPLPNEIQPAEIKKKKAKQSPLPPSRSAVTASTKNDETLSVARTPAPSMFKQPDSGRGSGGVKRQRSTGDCPETTPVVQKVELHLVPSSSSSSSLRSSSIGSSNVSVQNRSVNRTGTGRIEEKNKNAEKLVNRTERSSRQQAVKPIEKLGRRRGRKEESSDEESEEEEEEEGDDIFDVTPKKSRRCAPSTSNGSSSRTLKPAKKTYNREKWLEEKLNEFLLLHGQEAVPKDGQREIDVEAIVKEKHYRNMKYKKSFDTVGGRVKNMIRYLRDTPGLVHGLQLPDDDVPVFGTMEVIDKQINELEKKRRRH